VKTSCGYGTPLFAYRGERPSLDNWACSKGEEGLEACRREKNLVQHRRPADRPARRGLMIGGAGRRFRVGARPSARVKIYFKLPAIPGATPSSTLRVGG
jgi:hypothetical protein